MRDFTHTAASRHRRRVAHQQSLLIYIVLIHHYGQRIGWTAGLHQQVRQLVVESTQKGALNVGFACAFNRLQLSPLLFAREVLQTIHIQSA